MRLIRLTLILLLGMTVPVQAADWNAGTGGNPARNCASGEVGPTSPEILWQGGQPSVIAQAPVIEGDIVVMSRIHNINDVLHGTRIVAHDLQTGDTLWTRELPVDFPSTDWRSRVSAIRDGNVYATRAGNTNDAYLYALDAATGDMVWQSQDLIDESSTESAAFAPNGDLIIGNFNSLMRINANDGTTVWQTARSCPSSNGCEAAIGNGRAYAWQSSPGGPRLAAFDLETGESLYQTEELGGLVQQVAPFVGPDGTVFAPRTQNNVATDYLYAYNDRGTELNEKWSMPLGYVPFATFAVGPDGSVYSFTTNKEILRLDGQTGTVLNASLSLSSDSFQPRMAVDANGILFVSNGAFNSGAIFSFNPDLTLRWTENVANINIGAPALGPDGTLIVCGIGTDVRAYWTEPTHVEDTPPQAESLPALRLAQNYPNPFVSHTTLHFALPKAGHASLSIYNAAGQRVDTLLDSRTNAGSYDVVWNAEDVPGGVYFYRLELDGTTETRKMILMR